MDFVELAHLIETGPQQALIDALVSLDEAQRRSLSKQVLALYRKVKRDSDERQRADWNAGESPSLMRAVLAVLGVCPISSVKRVDRWLLHRLQAATVDVLEARRPEWADDFVAWMLDGEWPRLAWEQVRALMAAGVIERPEHDGYIRLMESGLNRWNHLGTEPYIPLSRMLLADSDLLEWEVWRLFEVETTALYEDNWHAPDKPDDYETWTEALGKLAAEGHVDRQRLIEASLTAVDHSENRNQLKAWRSFYESLDPDAGEKQALQAMFRRMLNHPVPAVVGFALKQLRQVQRAGGLEGTEAVGAAMGVMSLPQKSHANTALVMLAGVLKAEPDAVEAGVELVAAALHHPADDVVERALKLVESGAVPVDRVQDALREVVDEIPQVLRPRVAALLGADHVDDSEDPVERDDGWAEELLEALSALPEAVRIRAGAIAGSTGQLVGALPAPLECEPDRLLEALEPVTPIADLEELIDAVGHAVEQVDSADEVERIVDGIARLGTDRPADFGARVEPLRHRIENRTPSDGDRGLFHWYTPNGLTDLVRSWLENARYRTSYSEYQRISGPYRFLDARLEEICQRVGVSLAGPVLAAPTHAGGWLDPRVLVARVQQLEAAEMEPPQADLVGALLRLAPDGRAEALEQARDLGAPLGGPLRWALGGDEGPTRGDRAWAAAWVAAGRTRWPRAHLHEALDELGLDPEPPGLLHPARIRSEPRDQQVVIYGKQETRRTVVVEVECEPQPAADEPQPQGFVAGLLSSFGLGGMGRNRVDTDLLPTVLDHVRDEKNWGAIGSHADWSIHWAATVWPANPDGQAVRGIQWMMMRMDEKSSVFDPHYAFIEFVFCPARPWTPVVIVALWCAALSRSEDNRRAGIDALIEGIADGRAHPDTLWPAVWVLEQGGALRVNRLAAVAGEVAAVSDLHALVVAQVLEQLLAAQDALPRGAHALLAVLHEACLRLKRPVAPAVRELLGRQKGSSKQAKLSGALLKVEAGDPAAELQQAHLEAWQARLSWIEQFLDVSGR